MTDTIVVQIPAWMFYAFSGLFVINWVLTLYLKRLQRKLAEMLEDLKND